jgi:hypothetical protein
MRDQALARQTGIADGAPAVVELLVPDEDVTLATVEFFLHERALQ